jgi:hypothetical protein
MILKAAVETGSRNFAKRAQEIVPVVFEPSDAPVVNGVAFRVPGRSEFVFHIQVPFINTALQVMNLMASRGPLQSVSSPGRVQADGLVAADPMGPPVDASNRPNLEREYAMNVRAALIDAILDNSGGLPIGTTDSLLVYASGSDASAGANPLTQTVPRKLLLSITGADRRSATGQDGRDEAKRVKVQSF